MKIRSAVILTGVLFLAACGGRGTQYSSARAVDNTAPVAAQLPAGGATEGAVEGAEAAPTPPPFARGPLFAACLADGRKAATSARCGCVQAVANAELTNAQQRRGAKLWTDPATLQEIRQSDNASNEKFWRAWKAFAAKSVETCKAS